MATQARQRLGSKDCNARGPIASHPSTSKDPVTFLTPFGFAGAYTDSTGLTYLINRYYDSSTGQFLSVDPDVAMTSQAYLYAGDDPLNATDPTGLCSVWNVFCQVQQHWRGVVKVVAVVASVAACTTVIGCIAIGAGTSAVFYSAGTVGTSKFSLTGLAISTGVGAGLGGVSALGSKIAAAGSKEISNTLDKSLVSKVIHPVATVKAIAKGAAKVVAGRVIKATVNAGAVICSTKRGCP